MKKRKLLLGLIVPALMLTSCTTILANSSPTVKALDDTPVKMVQVQVTPNIDITDGGGSGGSSYSSGYTSTGYPSFYGYETHSHVVKTSFGASATDYTSKVYDDTGIKIYGSSTSTSVGSTNSISINQSSPYVDFSNATLNKPSECVTSSTSTSSTVSMDTHYLFEIYSGTTRKFYVEATITYSDSTEKYTKVINKNGSKTTTASSDYSFSPSEFGKLSSGLYSGSYTLKLSKTYEWMTVGSSIGVSYYETTTSLSGSLLIDYATPSLSMKGATNGTTISSGSYSSQRAVVSASDANFAYLYYKNPGSSYYSLTSSTSLTSGTTPGWYYYYATDKAGNTTSTYSFYYDPDKPTGVIYSGGTSISSGSYVSSSFSYSASDSASGIKNIYYKSPVSGTYQSYTSGTIIPTTAGDGWYYFYAVDMAGNVSETSSVYLETSNPYVTIYRNNEVVYTKSVGTGGTFGTDLYFNEGDLIKVTCQTSSGVVTSNFTLNQNIQLVSSSYPNSNYTISLETATGINANIPFVLVKEKPTLVINNQTYTSGSTIYLNEDTTVNFDIDDAIHAYGTTGANIVATGDINSTEFVYYGNSFSKYLTTSEGTTTTYQITLNDKAGNTSTFRVIIDKDPTDASWISNGKEIENGGYTNQPVSLTFANDGTTATYSKDGGEYSSYTSGTVFSAEGTYNVVLVDLSGNKITYTIHIDKTAPTGTLYSNFSKVESGAVVNKPIYFTWDGDSTCLVNGNAYEKNEVLSTDGKYTFVLTDKAGNSTSYSIEIDTVAPSYNQNNLNNDDSYLTSTWYTVEINGTKKSFKNYEDALSYACSIEMSNYVTTLELTDINSFTQTHLVASNGSAENTNDDVRTGTYWRYKSQANSSTELYYFDEELLHQVVSYYAKNYVSEVNHLQNGVTPSLGEIDSSMIDNIFTNGEIAAPIANHYIFESNDSQSVYATLVGTTDKTKVNYGVELGSQIKVTGLYLIEETDKAGNTSSYYVYLDFDAPEILVDAEIFGSEEVKEFTITKDALTSISAYYYKSFDIKSVIDLDTWSKVAITNDGKTTYYTQSDDIPCLNVGGKYDIEVYDRLGNSYSFRVYIVGNEASVTFINNEDDTAFDIDITLEQDFDTLVSLEIYKDGVKLDNVSTDTLHYTFTKDGNYTIKMQDNFGRVIEKNYDFNKALPTGTLNGASDKGRTNGDVSFTYDSTKFYTEVYKNGTLITTDYDGVVEISASDSTSGDYQFKVIRKDDLDNYNIYEFTIDTIAPTINVTGVTNGGTTNGNVTISWNDEDVTSSTYKNNVDVDVDFTNNTTFSEEGTYTVTLSDDLGNTSTLTFTIDKSLNYEVTSVQTMDSLEGGDTTSGSFSVIDNEKGLAITVTKNGVAYDYQFGDVIYEEGTYTFRITDDYGNSTSFTITIDKSVDYEINVGNGSITNDDVVIEGNEKINIVVLKDGVSYDYTLGQSLTEEGNYKVILSDAYGNVEELNFRIIKSIQTQINYQLGDDVGITGITKDGENIEVNGNTLNFTEDGTYTIYVDVDGRSYSFELTLDTTGPNVDLSNVDNEGTTSGDVTVSFDEEDVTSATIQKIGDGESTILTNNSTFTEEGTYIVTLTDDLGNTSIYRFTIDKTAPDITLSGVENGGTTSGDVTVSFNEEDVYSSTYKNNVDVDVDFTNNTTFTEEGTYTIILTDKYGNTSTYTFTIDKSVSYEINVIDGSISSEDVLIQAGENVNITITKDGESYEYVEGQALTEEGDYQVVLTDEFGNKEELNFKIVKSAKTTIDYQLDEDIEIVSVTKDGEVVEIDGNNLNFTEDGTYEITVRKQGKEYTFKLTLDTTAPDITINGIEDGGVADTTVTITDMSEEGTIKVYKDGELIEYQIGDEIKDYGDYKIEVTDTLGNTRTYSFTLKYQMNTWSIALIGIGVATFVGLGVLIVLKKKNPFNEKKKKM